MQLLREKEQGIMWPFTFATPRSREAACFRDPITVLEVFSESCYFLAGHHVTIGLVEYLGPLLDGT